MVPQPSDQTDSLTALVTMTDVWAARERIAGHIRTTPVWQVTIDTPTGPREVILKLEHLQLSGTFKARGAFNAVRRTIAQPDPGPSRFVIASGGNAGIAAALACRAGNAELTVVLPNWAPDSKVRRLLSIGAKVVLEGETHSDTHEVVQRLSQQTGAVKLHPYDSVDAVAGAGTLALELAEQCPEHGSVVVSVGGGGLVAGTATVGHSSGRRTIGVEPTGAPTLHSARLAGRPVDVEIDTQAADSLGAARLGELAFQACGNDPLVTSLLVTDDEIEVARKYLWEQFRLNVELSAAAALAGVITGRLPALDAIPVVVLCGANIPDL